MNEVRIPYKANKLILIFLILVSCGFAVFLGYTALNNNSGLIIMDLITLGVEGSTRFFWAASLFFGFLAMTSLLTFLKNIKAEREIVITDSSITSPKSGLSNQDITVNYADIRNISVQNIAGTKMLQIDHPAGKLSIPNSMVPSKRAFEELIAAVESRLGAHRSIES